MPLEIVVTNAGRAALINAQNSGTNPVTITEVGLSSTAVTPLPTLTALAGEFKRVETVSGEVVADDTIHLSMLDSSVDSYTLRSIGIYLADGTLFAVYGQPAAILEKTASSVGALQVDIIFADISAALLTFGDSNFLNPPATTERQGVVELATVAEAQAGVDALRALTPAGAKAAILGWLLAQDGAGSGLDADLLDGQHGSWYTDITGRLGYTPLNAVAYTAADVLGKLVTVDGAGSGVDADLLDGQHGSYYGNIPARLGFTPVQQGTGVGQLPNLIKIGWSGSRIKATIDAADLGNIAFDSHIADVWRSSNDGAGSGLDADLLDGVHAASFARVDTGAGVTFAGGVTVPYLRSTGAGNIDGAFGIGGALTVGAAGATFAGGLTAVYLRSAGAADIDGVLRIAGALAWSAGNDGAGSGLDADLLDGLHASDFLRDAGSSVELTGYLRLSNGFILQWGWVAAMTNRANNTVTFPITFPVSAMVMWASLGTGIGIGDNTFSVGAAPISNSQGRVAIATPTTGTIGCYWFALGK